ncbi:unnamed protein product [Paramecium primaurelia]|uniref:Uncharacterized protein n=1 Tax=Paramecium primaurelia TaxID=5886 RepID=A0A8S1NAT8_PARPR|nr:unnamed protein product [Paramecium primaurelia]
MNDYDFLIYKTIELNPHYLLFLSFKFWRIDQWDNKYFSVYIDNKLIHGAVYSHTSSPSDLCGSTSYNDEYYSISGIIDHTSTTVFIVMLAQRGIWGISELEISIEQCPIGCYSCNKDQCLDEYFSSEGWIKDGMVQTSVNGCLDWKYGNVNSGKNLMKVLKLDQHTAISFQLKVLIFNLNPINVFIKIDDVIVFQTEYSNGWININDDEELCVFMQMKNIKIHQYTHIKQQIQISVLLNENSKFGIRDFQLFLGTSYFQNMCTDYNFLAFDGCFSNIYDCVEGCSNCIKGECWDCQEGWEYNRYLRICIPICGDSIIINYEQCDDGNQMPNDGCHLCIYSCIQHCLLCQFGICHQCNPTYRLSADETICIRIDDQDEQNFIQTQQFQSDLRLCSIECQICQECSDIKENSCYHICQQKIEESLETVEENKEEEEQEQEEEEMDENLNIECMSYCLQCADQYSCLQCEVNFQLENKQCFPICGDGIIIQGYEDCEDGNNDPYDGCYKCQFQCSFGCISCEQGNICRKCDNFTILNNDTGKCEKEDIYNANQFTEQNNTNSSSILGIQNSILDDNLCGNGILNNNYELCDDGNNVGDDGCSSMCLIEDNWNCKNQFYQSICFPKTQLLLTYLNHSNSYQYIELSFSNQVKTIQSNVNFIDCIDIKLSTKKYSFSIKEVVGISQQIFSIPIYQIQINFYDSIVNPILSISINSKLKDINNFEVSNNKKNITLQSVIILSSIQKNVAVKIYNFGFWMMIGLGSGSAFLILFGEILQFSEILDILQFQSYQRFINVKYPENMEIYFQTSELVTVTPVLMNLKFIDFFDKIIGYQFIDSVGKLHEYNINSDLLFNIYGQITQIFLLIGFELFLRFYKKVFISQVFDVKQIGQKIKIIKQIRILNWFKLKFYMIGMKIFKLKSILTYQVFTQIFYANSLDLSFKTINHLLSNNDQNIRSTISIFISIIYLFMAILFIIKSLRRIHSKHQLHYLRNEQHEGLLILKKLLFSLILIGMQTQPAIQCLLLTFINFCYLSFLINMKKYSKNKNDLINNIWVEVPVMIVTFLNIPYISEFRKYLTPNQYINLGFTQMGILIFGLLGPLVRCSIQFFIKFKAIKTIFPQNQIKKQPSRQNLNIFQMEQLQ